MPRLHRHLSYSYPLQGIVIIYLAPSLLLLAMLVMATRLRRRIEPECPSCADRSWNETPVGMACVGCGWSTSSRGEAAPSRQAA